MTTIHLTNPLMHGPKVRQLQKLMHQHGYFLGEADGVAGPNTCRAFEVSKYELGYAKADIKPYAGQTLIDYLVDPSTRPKQYKERAEARQHTSYLKFEEIATRAKIVTIAEWGVKNSSKIHYSQQRPIDGTNHPYELPLYIDCSGFVTLCYQWGGANDPNGRGFDGLGYTGTLLQHMKHITLEQVKRADICVWGKYPGHHTAIAISGGSNPNMVSHGQESDPRFISFHEESEYQSSYTTWLRLPAWA